jgi:iron complex outermembrane receptor protein
MIVRVSIVALAACLIACPALADDRDEGGPETIVVTGKRDPLKIEQKTDTGSRLGLTVMETPAAVEILTQEDFQFRGLRTAREAFADVPGAIAGNVPGNPAAVMMRGFSGNVISILQDGVRISTSTVVQRDTNTWHFDQIEVIKGPASVLFGEGALGGVINKVTRKPVFGDNHRDVLLSYGSFDSFTTAGGLNQKLTEKVAVRADVSYMRSDSLYDVQDNKTRSSGVTGSLLFQPSPDMSVLVAVDHYNDLYSGTYQGVPLVPGTIAREASDALTAANSLVIDKALRRINYNPEGSFSGADETTVRSRLDWDLAGGWVVAANFTWYTADRSFVYSGTQNYAAPTTAFPNGSFQRAVSRFYHDHTFWNLRATVANDNAFAGLRNRMTIGAEVNVTDFASLRESSAVGAVPAVDPFTPVVGTMPANSSAYAASNVNFDSRQKTVSVFAEDALNLTPGWLLVAGARYDHIDLERDVTDFLVTPNTVTSSNPIYKPFSWRVGTTYTVTRGLTLYGQYTTAVVPVSSILLQSIANTRFRLTTGYSYEAGFKLTAGEQRVTITGAAYKIEQDDILTRDPTNPLLTVQGGTQSSRGIELSVGAAVTDQFAVGGGLGYTDAQYDLLIEAGNIDRSGNRPINVPLTTANAFAAYFLPGVPVTVSGFVRHVSGFYTDTANTIFVKGRTTFDAAVAWQFANDTSLTVRGRNLSDAFYVEYSGYPTTNVYIGAPRSLEVSLSTRF